MALQNNSAKQNPAAPILNTTRLETYTPELHHEASALAPYLFRSI